MTEQRTPLDQVVDLLVFAPLGLALTIREELPRLIERGKSQTDPQVALARMLGQMAVGKGQQEAGKMLNQFWARLSGESSSRDEEPEPVPATPPPAKAAPSSPPEATPSAEELAIPGYDALSAPQVVQRLNGLSPEELRAVGAYEAATRHRQTILGRIAQLESADS